jgi:hypothetical protein
MATDTLFDDRLTALEREVSELKKRVEPTSTSNWLKMVEGSMEQEPDFAKVLELGRAARIADRTSGEPSN